MRKKSLWKIVLASAFCMALSLAAVINVSAYSDDMFTDISLTEAEDFYTVITDVQGDTHRLEGMVNANSLEISSAVEKIASYEIFDGSGSLINVKLNDILSEGSAELSSVAGTKTTNGYYSVRFPLTGSKSKEVFLTGLSDSNLNMVQEKLLAAKIAHSNFTLESLDFIDTEKKNMPDDGDDQQSWAAATSNILYYTGWGEKADAGFKSADDLMDLFSESFTNAGANAYAGMCWFFGGAFPGQTWVNWARVKEYGKSGAYLKEYDIYELMDVFNVKGDHTQMKRAAKLIEDGYGVVANVEWRNSAGIRTGGHAITAWGYICDKDYDSSDARFYSNLIVSDSDSDQQESPNRRVAPNKLMVLSMIPYTSGEDYDTWSFDGYSDDYGVLESFIYLEPYSDSIEVEKDPDAKLDRINYADIALLWDPSISVDKDLKKEIVDTVSEDSDIFIFPEIDNSSDKDLTEDFNIHAVVKNEGGETVLEKDYLFTADIAANGYVNISTLEGLNIGKLPKGNYTITLEANSDRKVEEAYYSNNSNTYEFSVSDVSYSQVGAKFSANIGTLGGDVAQVGLSYENIDKVAAFEGKKVNYKIFASYYDGEAWDNYEMVTESDESFSYDRIASVLPESVEMEVYEQKVRFMLAIADEEESLPALTVTSPEYELKYSVLAPVKNGANTGIYTNLSQGEKKLADEEIFAFNVENTSTYDSGPLEYNVVVYAEKEGKKTELFRADDLSLGYRATSDVISVNHWDAELSGKYNIYAKVESDYVNEAALLLGTLAVYEQPSCLVTTGNDVVDPYDGLISLREAIAYMAKGEAAEDEITFSVSSVSVSEPILISSKITINGEPSAQEDKDLIGSDISGGKKAQIFKVDKDGTLNMKNIAFWNSESLEYGGAIESNGGAVSLEKCHFSKNKSGISGGAIYANGGTVTLKDCTFRLNTSGYGGAIGVAGGAVVNMLNNDVISNESNGGAVYNNGGTVNAVYTTFNDNASKSTGGGAVTSTSAGTTNLIGCIAAGNGNVDLSGTISVYGSYVDSADSMVEFDSSTQRGNQAELFILDEYGKAVWKVRGSGNTLFYVPDISTKVNEGIWIKNESGQMSISTDGSSWTKIGVNSVFTDTEYSCDKFGEGHDGLFGSYAAIGKNIKITDATDNRVMFFLPEAKELSLIVSGYNADGQLTSVKVYTGAYAAGTNTVTVDKNSADFRKIILCDSADTMIPLCEAFEY